MKTFAMADWDGTVRFWTWAGLLVLAVIIALGWYWHQWWITLLVLVLYLLIYAFSPRSYCIYPGELVITRLVEGIHVPLDSDTVIDIVTNPPLMRTIGDEGLFSYYGTFEGPSGAEVKVYATSLNKMVRIKTRDTTYYLSPDDPDLFVQAVLTIISG